MNRPGASLQPWTRTPLDPIEDGPLKSSVKTLSILSLKPDSKSARKRLDQALKDAGVRKLVLLRNTLHAHLTSQPCTTYSIAHRAACQVTAASAAREVHKADAGTSLKDLRNATFPTGIRLLFTRDQHPPRFADVERVGTNGVATCRAIVDADEQFDVTVADQSHSLLDALEGLRQSQRKNPRSTPQWVIDDFNRICALAPPRLAAQIQAIMAQARSLQVRIAQVIDFVATQRILLDIDAADLGLTPSFVALPGMNPEPAPAPEPEPEPEPLLLLPSVLPEPEPESSLDLDEQAIAELELALGAVFEQGFADGPATVKDVEEDMEKFDELADAVEVATKTTTDRSRRNSVGTQGRRR